MDPLAELDEVVGRTISKAEIIDGLLHLKFDDGSIMLLEIVGFPLHLKR